MKLCVEFPDSVGRDILKVFTFKEITSYGTDGQD